MLQYPSGGYCTFRRFTELQVPYSVGPENNYSPLWWDFLVEPPIQQTFWNFFPIEVNKFLSKLWLLHVRPPPPPNRIFKDPAYNYDGMDIFRDPTFQTTTVYVLCSRII